MTEQGSNGTGATRFPASILGEVRSRWPQLAIHAEPFVEYAQQRNVDLTAISDEIGADLYLAFACFSQFSGAIHAFYQCHAPRMRAVGRRFDESEFFADEILQRVSERLFVSSAHHPSGIGQYRGEAPLSAWVNTIARRVALRQAKSVRPERILDEEMLANEVSEACDQELALLRAQHRDVVRSAMMTALRAMPQRERRFLQMNLLAGVSMARIGKLYGISQSSVSRKIQRAINNVIASAKGEVRAKLNLSSSELESVFRLIQSCMDLTLTQFSEPWPDAPAPALETDLGAPATSSLVAEELA